MTTYIIKSSVSLLLMFGIYWFLLRKEKLFVFNRFFLISSLVFSLAVPFVSIPVNFSAAPQLSDFIPAYDYVIPEVGTTNNMITQNENISQPDVEKQYSPINIPEILLVLYITVVILFLIRFLRNIYILIRRSKLYEKVCFKGYRIILTDDNKGPYCFLSTIFLNREDYLNDRIDKELFNHELEHVRQSHTIDILLIELVKIFYWFNPVHLLYDRAIRLNHEYLADNGVISKNYDIKDYTDKLLSFITGRSNISLTSGLNHSFTKKRLLMMTKTKSKSSVYGLRIAITLSLILVFSLFLSFTQSNKQPSDKDTASGGSTDLQTQTIKDIDGNIYKTVTIGNYVWMAENLKTTRYNDGKNIPVVTDNEQWQKYEQGYCWYNNDKAENRNIYGALYNWYAVSTNKLCPVGWHVPDKGELMSFINFPPLDTITGGNLKETGTVHWRIPNTGATNKTGFTAFPGGFREMDGNFGYLGEIGQWWTSHEENDYVGLGWVLTYKNGRVGPAIPSKRFGFSVRCIKDYSKGASFSSIKGGEQTQSIVRGIVVTEDGKPLAEAKVSTIRSDNNTYVTSTSFDGHFSIDDLSAGTPILIMRLGFKGQSIKADFTTEMIVRLVRDPDYKGKIMIPEIENVNFRNSDFSPAKSLIVIDGIITDYKANLRVYPGEIRSFKILTGKEATDKYGDKGKDGVVEIMLYGNKAGSQGKKQAVSDDALSDTSKHVKYLSINHITNKGELIDIPVSNLQYVSVWTYHDIDNTDKKELRSIGIMTRDYFKVKGKVVRENGKPLPGVIISATDNPVTEISDTYGRFLIEDVREDVLLEFSLPGYKTYYLSTLYEVAFNEELTIKLEKD